MSADAAAELEELRAAAREALKALRAELDDSSLSRSIVSEHHLVALGQLVGIDWRAKA